MRLSLATRIFLGYAVVLATFGAVSIFSVYQMHQNQLEIRLVSEGYVPLWQNAAEIKHFHENQEKDTARLGDETNGVDTRRAMMRLAQLYFPGLMSQKINEGRKHAAYVLEFAPDWEKDFVLGVSKTFDDLQKRYEEYEQLANSVFADLESAKPDWPAVKERLYHVKQMEKTIAGRIGQLHQSLQNRMLEKVKLTSARERNTGVTIIGLSVLAIAVGLLVTAISARTLRPVRTLTDAVSRIGRGDYSAQLGVRGDDEISVLAREFDTMAKSLKEREAQLKEKQEALLRAEQLAAVGRISAQVAHEVRNPLSSIGLNVEMLDEHLLRAKFPTDADGREAHDLLSAMTREIDRLTEITEEYLKMARLPTPSLGPEDVNEVLSTVLDFSRGELDRAAIEVERRLDPSAPLALADEGQLRQVFLNLLRNSREAMNPGGKLTVESKAVDGNVEVRIADTGPGVPAEARERLFEPFFSTKEGGTGLGLAVSRQILQSHGGSIDCETTPGGGATFVIRLRRA